MTARPCCGTEIGEPHEPGCPFEPREDRPPDYGGPVEVRVVEVPYPPITWPEAAWPTPEQAADWLTSMSREQLVRWCGELAGRLELGHRCFLQDHEGRLAVAAAQLRVADEAVAAMSRFAAWRRRLQVAAQAAVEIVAGQRDEARREAEEWRRRAYEEADHAGQEQLEPLPWEQPSEASSS